MLNENVKMDGDVPYKPVRMPKYQKENVMPFYIGPAVPLKYVSKVKSVSD